MTRLSQKEKIYGVAVGVYGLIALAILMVPHFGDQVPKGAISPFAQWLVGTLAVLLGIGLILTGIRIAAGLEMAAAAVFGPWSTHLLYAFPLVVWAGFVSFKRGARLPRGSARTAGTRNRPGGKSVIDANSTVRKPPKASRRYTPPKQSRKK
ncbi:MAG: hypothetical protein EPN30_03870 [Actinomycetota bacterium]|nr:MAG: hypothetical protein EPN30_03870 [Actinomycetota bacterium]